jgi:hypothetical protein
LCRDGALDWCRGLRTRWISDRPFAVGTTREAKVLGLLTVQERYFVWEEGRRQAFFVTEADLPLFRSLAEDYVIEPDGPDRCQFTWSAAAAPTTLGRPGAPLNKLLLESIFRATPATSTPTPKAPAIVLLSQPDGGHRLDELDDTEPASKLHGAHAGGRGRSAYRRAQVARVRRSSGARSIIGHAVPGSATVFLTMCQPRLIRPD